MRFYKYLITYCTIDSYPVEHYNVGMIEINNIQSSKRLIAQNQLTNQLAIYQSTNWEIFHLAKQLKYSFYVPRCAILLIQKGAPRDEDLHFSDALHMILSGFPNESEDIFGSISEDRFLIFKAVSSEETENGNPENVEVFIHRIMELAEQIFGLSFTAFVGSIYTNLSWMHASYDEVAFLSSDPAIRETGPGEIISIDQHIGEYLISILPDDYSSAFQREYQRMFGSSSKDYRTIKSLISNNYNISSAAGELDLHRNTLVQRLNRLEEHEGLDPVHSSGDRTALHLFSVITEKPVLWNACINISINNNVHLGFEHLSRVLAEKTAGKFQLNVTVLSASGDYRTLFRAVSNNEADCASVNTSAMGSIFKEWPDILEYPFLFESEQEAQYLMDHSIREGLQSFLANSDVLVMALWSMGWREFSSAEPIIAPNNLYGKKVRTLFSSANAHAFFRFLGADMFHLNYSDLDSAMANQIIDVQENPYSNISEMKFYRHHRFVTALRAFYDANAVLCSEASWNKLTESMQQAFREALDETTNWLVKTSMRKNEAALRELLNHGMKQTKPDLQILSVWKSVADQIYRTSSNTELYNAVIKERTSYRGSI